MKTISVYLDNNAETTNKTIGTQHTVRSQTNDHDSSSHSTCRLAHHRLDYHLTTIISIGNIVSIMILIVNRYSLAPADSMTSDEQRVGKVAFKGILALGAVTALVLRHADFLSQVQGFGFRAPLKARSLDFTVRVYGRRISGSA